jgi:hypothetical protein
MKKLLYLATVVALCAAPLYSKDKKEAPKSATVMEWPPDRPALRFTFGTFKEMGSYGPQKTYSSEVTIQNLWDKPIESASFSVFLIDSSQVRIGESGLSVSKLGVGETIRTTVVFSTNGTPATLKLDPRETPAGLGPPKPAHKITLTVYSVPPGAQLTVDGKPSGTTPIQVEFTDGQHNLEFTKEGFASGKFVHNVGPQDASGGNVTVELAGLTHDTVELRDGSTIIGDVQHVDAQSVVVTVAGQDMSYPRNQVKKMLLIEREPPPAQPPSPKRATNPR